MLKNIGEKRFYSNNINSIPVINHIKRTNSISFSLTEDVVYGMLVGNYTCTITKQLGDTGLLYGFTDVGDTLSAGVGLNVKDWYGLNLYVSSNIGFRSRVQLTPWVTYGADINLLEEVSFSIGFINDDVTKEHTISLGWLTLAGAYVYTEGYLKEKIAELIFGIGKVFF